MAEKRIFSGIQPSGELHIGTYIGAIKQWVELQHDYECIYSIVDLHAITVPQEPKKLQERIYRQLALYLTLGIDPEQSLVFIQSHNKDHAQLAWILDCVASMGQLKRMTQYKSKSEKLKGKASVGLFNYPVLMAADILLYKADAVPVGIDQEPHLEVARELSRKLNRQYDLDFPEPERFSTSGEYVPSLKGAGKMSKSIPGSYINLTDDLETIKERLAGAPTDSGKGKIEILDQKEQKPSTSIQAKKAYVDQTANTRSPGVGNLLILVEMFEGADKREEYEQQYQNTGIRYNQLKEELAQAIFQEIEPLQQKRQELLENPEYVDQVIEQGAAKATEAALQTIAAVKAKFGLS